MTGCQPIKTRSQLTIVECMRQRLKKLETIGKKRNKINYAILWQLKAKGRIWIGKNSTKPREIEERKEGVCSILGETKDLMIMIIFSAVLPVSSGSSSSTAIKSPISLARCRFFRAACIMAASGIAPDSSTFFTLSGLENRCTVVSDSSSSEDKSSFPKKAG